MKTYRLFGHNFPVSTNPAYRGTDRPEPSYVDSLPETAPVNAMWLAMVSSGIQGEYVDRAEAERMQDVFATHGFLFELVMVLDGEDIQEDALYSDLLGFDVSYPNDSSFLSENLRFGRPASEYQRRNDDEPYEPLLWLIEGYFRPRLNAFSLFSTFQDALLFMDVANSITKGFGNVWEYGPFDVKALILIRGRETYVQSSPPVEAKT